MDCENYAFVIKKRREIMRVHLLDEMRDVEYDKMYRCEIRDER